MVSSPTPSQQMIYKIYYSPNHPQLMQEEPVKFYVYAIFRTAAVTLDAKAYFFHAGAFFTHTVLLKSLELKPL
jgi:hypothetical protein